LITTASSEVILAQFNGTIHPGVKLH